MVAGYHNGAYACFSTFVDCGFNFGTNGVYHTNKPHEAHIFFVVFGGVFALFRFQTLLRNRKHAERAVCHLFVCAKNFVLFVGCHRNFFAVLQIERATLDYFVGCALCKLQNVAVCVLMHSCHHLARGVERDFAHADEDVLLLVFIEIAKRGVVDQSTFGGFADGFALFLVVLCVRAKRHCVGKQVLVASVVVYDGHFVLRQRAGFVRTYDLRAAESSHGGELSDDCVAF